MASVAVVVHERAELEHVWRLVFDRVGEFTTRDAARSSRVCRLWRKLVVRVPLAIDLRLDADRRVFDEWVSSEGQGTRRVVALRGVGRHELQAAPYSSDGRRRSFLGRLGYGNNFRPDKRECAEHPVHLERIAFCAFFDQRISFLRAVGGLTELRLGDGFDSGIDTWQLPRGLRVLHTGRAFNKSFAVRGLPDTLAVLKFGELFYQHVDAWGLPRGLRVLAFGNWHPRPVDVAGLPPALRKLRLGHFLPPALESSALPPDLEELRLSACNARWLNTRGATYRLVWDVCHPGNGHVSTVMVALLWMFASCAAFLCRNLGAPAEVLLAVACAFAFRRVVSA